MEDLLLINRHKHKHLLSNYRAIADNANQDVLKETLWYMNSEGDPTGFLYKETFREGLSKVLTALIRPQDPGLQICVLAAPGSSSSRAFSFPRQVSLLIMRRSDESVRTVTEITRRMLEAQWDPSDEIQSAVNRIYSRAVISNAVYRARLPSDSQ